VIKRRRLTSSVSAVVREVLETALLIGLIFVIFRGVVQNFQIEGQSMEPSFHDRQYIWVNKIVYFHFDYNAPLRLLPAYRDLPPLVVYPHRTPQRGDVVVLEPPAYDGQRSREDYIKRVIGLPGETIQIRDGLVYINGQPLREGKAEGGYLEQETDCYGGRLCAPYTIPEGHVVVLGDNRTNSQDSRTWPGEPALPYNRIVGRAWLSYWPQQDWGFIPSPTYAEPAK
jgi:signal peptidase I